MNGRPNIVLVHGAWADGSCWSAVIERLQAAGHHVVAPQFPLTSLADDVTGATTVEVPSSHVAMVSHPSEVANLIETAAAGVPVAR